MFKLQRLEITGFKSFADYTEIVFTGDGITAVVGPNGCGKSNVSDSIAWVLGEQRAKSLRGEEMKDVIFQGTNKRAASGMAEVVLHLVADETNFEADELDNIDEALSEIDSRVVNLEAIEAANSETQNSPTADSNGHHADGTADAAIAEVVAVQASDAKTKSKRQWRPRRLELDFAPGESVSVTRRLYLSGESEYLLNGKTCRLRDIQDLFSGTGLSGAHYAMIEQGRIGQILSAKPSDRRTLIEEAAGISKFRTRQRAAETRLEAAKANLRRISDIVDEIDKQANALRRQAAKTRRYKVLKEELRVALRETFSAEGAHLTNLVQSLQTKLTEAQKRERAIFWEVAEKDEAFRAATQNARGAEENLSQMRSLHAENALKRDRASRDLEYKNEQTVVLKSRLETVCGEIRDTEQRLKLVRAEFERLERDEKKQAAEAEGEAASLREAEENYGQKVAEVRRVENELEKIRGALMNHTTAAERLAEIENQHAANLDRIAERVEGLRREGTRAEESLAANIADRRELEKELDKARKERANLDAEKIKLNDAASQSRGILKDAENRFSAIREDFSRTKNRLETLRELEQRRTIYAPTVQKLFAEQKKIGVSFAETLADKLNVEPQAEKAVENIFGAFLQTVLVETEADALKVMRYLSENNLGRIGILVTGNQRSVSNQPEAESRKPKANLIDFLGVSGEFAELLQKVFPRETSARVIENFDKIKLKETENFVDFGGDLIFGGKLFVAGKLNANEKNSSLLAFKRELRELAAKSAKLAGDFEKAERETTEACAVLSERENKLVDLQSFIAQSERNLLSREIQSKSLAQEIERAERHKKVVADETKQIEKESKEVAVKFAETKSNKEKAARARQNSSQELAKFSEKLNFARTAIENENAALNEKRTASATSAERRRALSSSLKRLENEQRELAGRLARQNLEIAETENKLNELTSSAAQITRQIEDAENEQTREQTELAEAVANLKTAREAADRMSDELGELNKISAEARNARGELEVRQAETVTRLQNLNEICAQELNQSLVELVESIETAEDFDLEAARGQTDDLRRRIESFGAVNMLALEELAETEERLLFLTVQRQDIVDGILAAEEALREIKERSRERFVHAFQAINGYFTEFFLELFGGGRGEMVLLEAEDVLESGIEIVAQPPGKRLQNILLLSGGEKAMTAIALVMAIFQYRPSPFCLLDEVDAPLDDANVGRFVNKIAAMSEKTQFIVITHNKRTMEAAKALYGVTMAEAGVSKVVSVKFE